MSRSTLVLRSPCVRAVNSLQTTKNQRKIFFEGRDKVREATGTIITRWTGGVRIERVLPENSKKQEEKKNRGPTRLHAVDGQTATEPNWNELCRSMSTGYVRGSIEHVLRLSSAPASKPPPTSATHRCTCNINHWSSLFRVILYQHLWYHFKDRNQSIKYHIKAIQ